MEELSRDILSYFETTRKKLTKEAAKKQFKIKGEGQTKIFDSVLMTLVENGSLFFNEKTEEYETMKNRPLLIPATIRFDKSGMAFVKKGTQKIYIEESDLNGALDNDNIIICNLYEKNNRFYGEVYQITKRSENKVILEVVGDGMNATLISPKGFNNHINVSLCKRDMMKLKDGNHIVVTVGTKEERGAFPAELEEIIDGSNDIKISTLLIARKFNIDTEFSEEAKKEARGIPTSVTEEDLVGRIDLRDKNFFTIDCDNTKDRDDAVCVEKLPNGNYMLYTSISHVSHYVKRGTALFDEAFKRCTSHYPNDDCIPMLPKEISNGICSLNENVDRLVRTFQIEIDPTGKIVDSSIYPAVINSRKEMTYSAVNRVLDREYVSELNDFKNDIYLINELNQILEANKEKRDCLDFNMAETEFIRGTNDSIIDVIEKPRGFAEKIIENFMVLTNNVTSSHYSWAPIIYRIHPEPEIETVKETIDMIRKAGCKFDEKLVINEYNSRKVIKQAINNLKDIESGNIFKRALIKSMKRAEYNTDNCGHYALNLDYYSHTTSPIRRLADLMMHTIIDEIDAGVFDIDNWKDYINQLNVICNNINKAERLDFEMERTAEAINIANYASKHIGESIKARIYEVTKNSLKLVTDNHIRGSLDFHDMHGCMCFYDKSKNEVYDKANHIRYATGKVIENAIIKSSNPADGTIKFETHFVKQKTKKKEIGLSF